MDFTTTVKREVLGKGKPATTPAPKVMVKTVAKVQADGHVVVEKVEPKKATVAPKSPALKQNGG